MPRPPWPLVRELSRHAGLVGASDAELLARFAADRDPAAFELLVWRHGRMVLAVCRRVLGDPHRADDAFQATFLILARKAGSVHGSAAGYLHRVAHRVAVRAAQFDATRLRRETHLTVEPFARPDAPADPLLRAVLDEEIDRLPDRLRLVVVMCYLDGRSTDEAAELLGVPRGTVLSRLSAARAKLASRLTHRGVTAPAVGLTAMSGAPNLSAVAVGWCVGEAVQFLGTGAAGSAAAILAEGVMTATKLKGISMAAGCLIVLTAGVGTGVGVAVGQKPGEPTPATAAKAEAKPKAEQPPAKPREPERKDETQALTDAIKDIDRRIRATSTIPVSRNIASQRVAQTELDELHVELRKAQAVQRQTELQGLRFMAAVEATAGVSAARKQHGTMQTHYLRKQHMPGVKSDDIDLLNMEREVERLRRQLVEEIERAMPEVEKTMPIPPYSEEWKKYFVVNMVAGKDRIGWATRLEVGYLEHQIAKVEDRLYGLQSFHSIQRIELDILREVREQLQREVVTRRLRADKVPVPATGGADRIDQLARDVADLKASLRTADGQDKLDALRQAVDALAAQVRTNQGRGNR